MAINTRLWMGSLKIAVIGLGENLVARQAEKKILTWHSKIVHHSMPASVKWYPDNAKVLAVVMLMYNLMEYKNNYANSLPCLWQCHKDGLNDNS